MAIGKVSLRGIIHDEWEYTFALAAGITQADEGKAVELDTSAANQVKLATASANVLGKLLKVENRAQEGILVGTVALKGPLKFDYTGTDLAVGDGIKGSTTVNGKVERVTGTDVDAATTGIDRTANERKNLVVEVDTTAKTAIVVML